MAPRPKIVDAKLWYNGKSYRPGDTVKIREGDKFYFEITVRNYGSPGTVYTWVYDFKNNRELWGEQDYLRRYRGRKYKTDDITADKDMEIKVQTWYWTGSEWKFYDETSSFVIQVGGNGGGGYARPLIVYACIWYKGRKYEPPAVIEASKGDEFYAEISIRNAGDSGNVYVWLYDFKNNRELWGKMDYFESWEYKTYETDRIRVDRDMEIKVQTWYWTGSKWEFCEEKGC